jgi:hypothetical protein
MTGPQLAPATSIRFLANQGFAPLEQQVGSVTSTLATTRPQAIVTDPQLATGSTTAAQASQSFALLTQYLAGNFGRVDPGQIVASVSNGVIAGQTSFLTRPQH